ncbi:MAG: tetratricopeptide repeat protein [Methanothrix sp.]
MSPSFQAGHALLIGAGADLPFTIDDARGIADILKDPERCAYPPGQVELLVGEATHRQAVLDALDRLAERADESSSVIIYFSGHGYRASTPIGDAYFLIPFGVQIERLKDTAISGSEFASRLQAIRSKKILLLLDCCHAGGIGLAKGLELAKSPLPPETLQILTQGKGRVIIASCKESELSYGGKPYSAFTLALIEAFCGEGASKQDGFVRASDLAMHAREKVPGRTKGRQHPILHFEEADNFVLAYYAAGETEPKGLPFDQEPEIEPEPGAWSGEVVDLRGSMGAIYKPSGSVSQHFGDINFNIPKAEEIPSNPTIPDPPSDFTGRDNELKEMLAKFASGTNIIGLRGNGGVGKTALALKLSESLKDRYPDGQVMVDMRGTSDNPLSPLEAMASVIHAYHPKEKIPDNEAEIKEMYRRVLNGKHALLLLDNALDDKQVLNLIPPKSCGLLVTSRKMIKLPGLFRKDLYVLKPEEALDLLLKVWCSTSSSEEPPKVDPAWSEIARLCGFLPLALRAAASLLANTPDLSPANYAEELKDERTRLERIGEEGVELSVDASFNLSFKRLDVKTQQTFLDLSVFPADFDGQAVEQICLDEGHKGLSELVRWSLVDYKPLVPDYGRYKLQNLARLFALTRQTVESMQTVHLNHAAYYEELLSAANNLYLRGGSNILAGLALFDREEMNIKVGQAWAKKNSEGNSSAAGLCVSYPDAGTDVLDLRLHPQEMIEWLQTALYASRQLKNREMESIHTGNLGIAYKNMGDARKAIEFCEQALAIDREIGNIRNEGGHLGNLGLAYSTMGDAKKAIEYHEQALAIAREIGDKREEGGDLGNLGGAYYDLGDARKAIEYYEQALAIDREIGDRMGEGNALGNLGLAYNALGEARKAIEYYEQALATAREIGYRRGKGADLGNLGNAYADLGDAKKAIERCEQRLVIAREIGDRRGEGYALGILGRAYKNLGEARKAIEYYEQALAIAREIGDRRGEGYALCNLGNPYADLGEARKAIEYYEQALAIAREIGDRRGEGYALDNLGRAYTNQGEACRAIEYCEQALAIVREIGDRRGEGYALCNLGSAYYSLSEMSKAIDYIKSALAI